MNPQACFSCSNQGQLVVNLNAVVQNWRNLRQRAGVAECGAVVKANAYGLGYAPIAKALLRAGCRVFFVACVAEGCALRACIDGESTIFVLSGFQGQDAQLYHEHQLVPVLNSLEQVARWLSAGLGAEPLAVMVDTGINRLGMSLGDIDGLLQIPGVQSLGLGWVFSHFACADEPAHDMNQLQIEKFESTLNKVRSYFPAARASLANTAGLFLPKQCVYQMVRPGIGLYGASPDPLHPLAAEPVVHLRLPVLQIRQITEPSYVGYGATQQVPAGTWLATVAGGYADGLMRSLSSNASGRFMGNAVPLVGRVSMDYCVFDITQAVPKDVNPEDLSETSIEMLGDHQTLDELAISAGTLPYELLTRLGERYQRTYLPVLEERQ